MFILLNKMKKNVRNSRTNQSEITSCYEACYYFELLRPVEVIDAFSDVGEVKNNEKPLGVRSREMRNVRLVCFLIMRIRQIIN
ncbi:hypothetical protein T4C_27 [Trichinella pseudospiralis]|uniref:Uncharacterized protein n=1 Tax=Trichinella pseudospiralis TaxID=6337 RepID=A0A0V1JV67_TRIPS|nr:hypothetical protein T4C_27 [Trichinella pseudospiralis]